MKRSILAFLVLASSTPAVAASYRVQLNPTATGKLLVGHAGVQAVDDRTSTALVRLVAPGNEVKERATVRILVMNLGTQPFEFGPDQVSIQLADGTRFHPTSIDDFEKGRQLVERESRRAAAVDLQARSNLEQLAQQGNSGVVPVANSTAGGTSVPSGTESQDRRSDESLLPGAKTLGAIYQLLVPQTVAANHAWGGYYVFDVPKAVFARKADQPLTVSVRTGREEHRFAGILKWK
jgi:hypothetical protein